GTFAAELALDVEEYLKQIARLERGMADDDGVQIGRLILEPLPFRFGFDEIGDSRVAQQDAEAIDGESEGGATVAEVAAQGDRHPAIGHGEPHPPRAAARPPPPVPAPSARRPRRSERPARACSKNRLCSSVSPRITF